MATWELVRDAMADAAQSGREWLTVGEITREVLSREPTTNTGTIHATVRYHCINDPSKKHSPGLQYKTNPLLVTDAPTVRGKRYRLLTDEERKSFLVNVRDDLESASYAATLEFLGNPSLIPLPLDIDADGEPSASEPEEAAGAALLELHLQDYLFRHWKTIFSHLTLYKGSEGREFRTSDPSVGIIDFLCIDASGDFVVIETKRDMADRKAVGQILGYMGWVSAKLCSAGQSVRGILIAAEPTQELEFAIAPVPGLELYRYEISFSVEPVASTIQYRSA